MMAISVTALNRCKIVVLFTNYGRSKMKNNVLLRAHYTINAKGWVNIYAIFLNFE